MVLGHFIKLDVPAYMYYVYSSISPVLVINTNKMEDVYLSLECFWSAKECAASKGCPFPSGRQMYNVAKFAHKWLSFIDYNDMLGVSTIQLIQGSFYIISIIVWTDAAVGEWLLFE